MIVDGEHKKGIGEVFTVLQNSVVYLVNYFIFGNTLKMY